MKIELAFFSPSVIIIMFNFIAKFVDETLSLDKAKELQDIIELTGLTLMIDYIDKNILEFLPDSKYRKANYEKIKGSIKIGIDGDIIYFSDGLFREYLLTIGFDKHIKEVMLFYKEIQRQVAEDSTITIPKIVLLHDSYFKEVFHLKIEVELMSIYKKVIYDFADAIWDLINDDDRTTIVEIIRDIITENKNSKYKNLRLYEKMIKINDGLRDYYLDQNSEEEQEKLSAVIKRYLPEILDIQQFMDENGVLEAKKIEFYSFDSRLREKSNPYEFLKDEMRSLDKTRNYYRSNNMGVNAKLIGFQKKHATGFCVEAFKYIRTFYKYTKKRE